MTHRNGATFRGRPEVTPARGAALVFALALLFGLFWAGASEKAAVTSFARSFEARFAAEIDRRKAVLDGFANAVGQYDVPDPQVRQLATDLAEPVGAWFVIVRPGQEAVYEMMTLGDGAIPPSIARTDQRYAVPLKAEKRASVTKAAVLTDVFIGLKSAVPTVSLVREVSFGQQLRYVYLSHSVDSFGPLLDVDAPVGMHVDLRDANGAQVQHAERWIDNLSIHDSWLVSVFFTKHAVHELPFGWTVSVHRHWLRPSTLAIPVLFAVVMSLLAHVLLRRAPRPQPVDATQPLRDRLAFVLTLGHELRSPLISLLSAIDAVKRKPDRGAEAFLDHATREAHGLLRLIDDVLDCAKLSQSDILVHEEPYSPEELARACIETVQPTVYPGVQLEVTVEGLADPLVGDRSKIRQILLNFLTNAAKFTMQGTIDLKVGVREKAPGLAEVVIVVSDTGEGMDERTLSHLFQRAGVLEGGAERNPKGNGLGLVTARLLAEAMGGTVGADSRQGSGSMFWLRLDQRVAPGQPKGATLSDACLRGMRIVVAEDDPIIGRVIVDDLSACGAQVTLVSDGQELVDICLTESFDVILTDLRMPRVSGYDAISRIRSTLHDAVPPVFAISAHYAASPFAQDGEGLFDGVLPKPFTVRNFVALLGEMHEAEEEVTAHDLPQMEALLRAYGARAGTLAQEVCDSVTSGYEECRETRELQRIGAICHRLSGVTLTIGMKRLGLQLLEVEQLCEAGDPQAVEEALVRLGPVIAEACDLLRARAEKAVLAAAA